MYPPTVDQGRRTARSPACLYGILKCNEDFAPRCNQLLLIKPQPWNVLAWCNATFVFICKFQDSRSKKFKVLMLDQRNAKILGNNIFSFYFLILISLLYYSNIRKNSPVKNFFYEILVSENKINYLIRIVGNSSTFEDGKKNQSEKTKCFARKYRGPLTGSSHWPSTINYTLYRIRGGPRGGES